jgi:hypothetical protein
MLKVYTDQIGCRLFLCNEENQSFKRSYNLVVDTEYILLRDVLSNSGHSFAGSNLVLSICVFVNGCVTTNKLMHCQVVNFSGVSAPGFSPSALQ